MTSICPHTFPVQRVYSDHCPVHGFGHAHLSGVGGECLGSVTVAAASGHRPPSRLAYTSVTSQERASPVSYQTCLDRFGIHMRATVTPRCGLSEFTWDADGDASLCLDLRETFSPRGGGFLRCLSDSLVVGYQEDGGFCGVDLPHRVYFALRVTGADAAPTLWSQGLPQSTKDIAAADAAVTWWCKARAGKPLRVAVGLSYVSWENALENAAAELGDDPDFGEIEQRLEAAWTEVFRVVSIEGATREDAVRFATALYHCCIHPNVFQDVNGHYSYTGGVGRIPPGRNRYSVFSLWDTYRSLFPLYALLWPDRLADILSTLLDIADETGFLPKWELCGNETYIMPGDPSAQILADAIFRGVSGIDIPRAYAAMRRNADTLDENGHSNVRPGLAAYLHHGYMPRDVEYPAGALWTTQVRGEVSYTLEYAHADFCIARVAEHLELAEDAERFRQRSRSWEALFDPDTRFIRPRNADGTWLTPFNPAQIGGGTWDKHSAPGFVEGNSWKYSFMVSHDIPQLILRMGGADAFALKLQDCFDCGQYDPTNEPDMAYAFLFNLAPGHAHRTQRMVTQCVQRFWHSGRDGIPGNDDCGTLSAWLVFAMLGFYPDCAGIPRYQISGPLLPRITLHPGTPQAFHIHAEKPSPAAWRISGMRINGRILEGHELPHSTLRRGGEWHVTFDGEP